MQEAQENETQMRICEIWTVRMELKNCNWADTDHAFAYDCNS